MERRTAKVSATKVGGNASKGALKYRLQLPTAWMQVMNITAEEREMELSFDGEKIIIKKGLTIGRQ